MSEKTEVKPDSLPDLDDLLQCPVCYEIPSGQIFQCNEGHHVCGRCKVRLDVCPVCRAFFFGTRNYAMEELIANVRKLRAFKLGGKVTTGSGSLDGSTTTKETTSEEPENEESDLLSDQSTLRAPQACKGLFRCLCCKNGNGERLPAGRLLNHLRYFHAPELIEGQSENGEYLQAWQFPTMPGRIVTAVRVSDMGVFFLIIEISNDTVCAWLSMAASPWVAHEFCYTVTLSGNDREAIFSDCVWSVRSCEGSLKKRGHCLIVNGLDARALVAPVTMNGKVSVRRAPADQLATQTQPRAVLRVANRGTVHDTERHAVQAAEIEPFLQDLQLNVERLSRAFSMLGHEVNTSVDYDERTDVIAEDSPQPQVAQNNAPVRTDATYLSRNARRRLRQRLRAALNDPHSPSDRSQPIPAHPQTQNGPVPTNSLDAVVTVALTPPAQPSPPAQPASGPSNGLPVNGNNNNVRTNKKKRRQRR